MTFPLGTPTLAVASVSPFLLFFRFLLSDFLLQIVNHRQLFLSVKGVPDFFLICDSAVDFRQILDVVACLLCVGKRAHMILGFIA